MAKFGSLQETQTGILEENFRGKLRSTLKLKSSERL